METTIWKLATRAALFAQEADGGGGEAAPAGNLFAMLLPFIVLAGIVWLLVHLYRRRQRAIEQDLLRPPRQKLKTRLAAGVRRGLRSIEQDLLRPPRQKPKLRPPRQKPKTRLAAPSWMLPAGIIAVAVGVLGFLASAALGGGDNAAGSLLAGLLNPLFFVGIPLGIYWLYRFGQAGNLRLPSVVDENNPKLTHCPDCGRHVSRLAPSCPHCGKPLTPDKTDS